MWRFLITSFLGMLFSQAVYSTSYTFHLFAVQSSENLENASWEEMGSPLNVKYLRKLRVDAFKLQAFGRVMKRAFDKKSEREMYQIAKQIQKDSKFIEDQIGSITYFEEMHEALSEKKGLDQSLQKISSQKVRNSHQNFLNKRQELQKKSENLVALVNQLILSSQDLRKDYLRGMKNEILRIRQKLEEIDPTQHEDGTHEFRRKIRWVSMYVFYPQGLFGDQKKNVKTNQYTSLKPSQENDPILIDHRVYFPISDAIYLLGKGKDEGSVENYITELKQGHADHNQSRPEEVQLTQKLLDQILKEGYLEALAGAV